MMVWPSRITVIVSHSLNTSSIRWEIYTIATPRAFILRIILNNVAVSRSVRAAVGSSMMTTFASNIKMRRISVICWWPTEQRPASVVSGNSMPSSRHVFSASASIAFLSSMPNLLRFGLIKYRFSNNVRFGQMLSSWWMKATPFSSASLGFGKVRSTPSMVMVPASALWIPVRIFMRVDLPAPFSPIKAWTSPSLRVILTSRSTWFVPNAFAMPDITISITTPIWWKYL